MNTPMSISDNDASAGRLEITSPGARCERAEFGKRPRLGFLGVGWIGRHRLEAIAQSGVAEIAAIADPSVELRSKAQAVAPAATMGADLGDLLQSDLDGIVIATPSAMHAEQSKAALSRGLPVFCQKPLGRSAAETRGVLQTAKSQNRLLGVDLSYRFMTGTRRIRELCQGGDLGDIYAADLVFHNAYGPDKPWFYDRKLSGGGCLIDLGIHLVDLAFWCLGEAQVRRATGKLFAQGKPLSRTEPQVEDYATAQLELANGAVVQLACSWRLPVGKAAIISGAFYGTREGAAFHNVNGSFYDFVAERFEGTRRTVLSDSPEAWGGRAAVDWARRLSQKESFDPEIEAVARVADSLDAIYQSNYEASSVECAAARIAQVSC
jgi:predicted dehydrogenase